MLLSAVIAEDTVIESRKWLMIDADPKRPSGTSSSDEEKKHAFEVISRIGKYLRDIGFAMPVVADSGNGYHLLYRITLGNTPENTDIIKRFLSALDMLFTDEAVSVDTAVSNPARITKLYGSLTTKGANSPERPHRYSSIMFVPDEVQVTSRELLKKVADIKPEPVKPSYQNNYSQAFDLRSFIQTHGIQIKSESPFSGGTKFVLENCLFDPSHKAPDAALFLMDSGAVAYKCFHNSCADHQWQDVRMMFEPDCYEKKADAERHRDTKPYKEKQPENPPSPKPNQAEAEPKFYRMIDITSVDRSKIIAVKTGITAMDKVIGGCNKGELSIWSGGTGSGKSTILSQIVLDSIQANFKTVMFSGELNRERVKNWLMIQAAGRQFTKQTAISKAYYVSDEHANLIDEWFQDYFWLYNNKYGMDVIQLLKDIDEHILKNNTDVVVIDNLMVLDLTQMDGSDKYDKQTRLVKKLSDLAKMWNVHIHFVCHPRKPTGFLRKEDISGTADLVNIADNVFIAHRVNRDFEKSIVEHYDRMMLDRIQSEKFTNVIEICKNRDLGVMDYLVGIYFEESSKRMLNQLHENKVYGWQSLLPASERVWEEIEVDEPVFPQTVERPVSGEQVKI